MNIKEIRLQNMKQLIVECGKQSTFAERLGIESNEVSQIKSPNSPRNIGDSLARRIEVEFDRPANWMDRLNQEQIAESPTREPNNISSFLFGSVSEWDSNTPLSSNDVEVDFYMEVEMAAGNGLEATEENKGFKLRFAKSFLRRRGVQAENAKCVLVNGDSMEPKLSSGDVVAIDTANTSINDGDTYAINHDGLLRIKRLYLIPGGGLRVSSFNSAEHPDEHLNAEERRSVNVIGRVFHSISDW